ncbi:hypothetical protein [Aurantiacibacter hainanensis]|uniref:hypothetical protein n=1 Tax=Aurantiacibacter hainanensis TaxID=3076114 RepID=UPI0030C777C6
MATLTLQGCIAAAALPIVAGGGALVRNSVSDDARSDGQVDIRNAAAPVARPTPAPTPTPALAAAEPPVPAAAPSAPEPAAAEPEQAPPAAIEDPAQPAEELATSQPLTEPPASANPAADRLAGRSAAQAALNMPAGEGYGALHGYAMRTLGEGLPMTSAMLADPTSLQPVRRDCAGNSPTVVIDLDPEDGLVPIAGPLAMNTELSRVLADLRMRDVSIAWMTDRGPVDARAVRDRLVAAGLDPEGSDSLYVERYPGETKQARRTALSETQCVIAVAGDTRSDFDDLYNYIIDQNDARPLEILLGNGWFLIDNPVGG